MLSRSSVLSHWSRTLLASADAIGISRDRVAAEIPFDLDWLTDPDSRVPGGVDLWLWRALTKETDDLFGLHFPENHISDSSFGPVGFAAKTSATVGEAMGRATQYRSVLKSYGSVRYVESHLGATIVEELGSPRDRAITMLVESCLSGYVSLARRWTGLPVCASEVNFKHQPNGSLAEYERVFGCPVIFGQAHNRVSFTHEVLVTPLPTAEPMLCAYLDQVVQTSLIEISQSSTLAARIRDLVAQHLTSGELQLSHVAKQLGMSARTLQRRLHDEHIAYQDIFDQVRREHAIELIADDNVAISELGDRLGFSDPRAFRRAFKRWTGHSPRDYRRLNRLGKLSLEQHAA